MIISKKTNEFAEQIVQLKYKHEEFTANSLIDRSGWFEGKHYTFIGTTHFYL